MKHNELRALLSSVQAGEVSIDDALTRLVGMPFEDLGYARVDHHRALRTGLPEVVFCPGKTGEQVKRIFESLAERSRPVMATRAASELYNAVKETVPDAQYNAVARMIYLPDETMEPKGSVVIASAGTADVPVGEEAAMTARLMGARVETFWDAGVAGIHRLLPKLELLRKATVIVVVAGMEGALPSVVAGLVQCPVIGVPTSVGYGASFGGIASLLGMLSSCAAGVSVVNIDNGFGAGYIAALINRRVCAC